MKHSCMSLTISMVSKKASAPNGPHYRRRVGLDLVAKRKCSKPEPTHLDGAIPAVRVHALLASTGKRNQLADAVV